MKETDLAEKWLPVVGYEEFYDVSNDGRVRTKQRRARHRAGLVLTPSTDSHGYLYINLCKNGTCKATKIHRIVALAFCVNQHGSPQVNHIDGNKTNNRAANLEWVTAAENARHAFDNGLRRGMRGASNGRAILSESDVLAIREIEGKTNAEIGRMFGVALTTVFSIRKRRIWKHV